VTPPRTSKGRSEDAAALDIFGRRKSVASASYFDRWSGFDIRIVIFRVDSNIRNDVCRYGMRMLESDR